MIATNKSEQKVDHKENICEYDSEEEYMLNTVALIKNDYTHHDAPFKLMLCVNSALAMGKVHRIYITILFFYRGHNNDIYRFICITVYIL